MERSNLTSEKNLQFPSIHEGNLILVNPDYPCQSQPSRLNEVRPAQNTVLLEDQSSRALMELFDRLEIVDEIVCFDGYRTHQQQIELYQNSLEENGQEYTEKFVAKPGCSEHECGLAIDLALNQDDIDPICPSFPDHGICGLFRKQAASAGFIERYKESKKEITKISGEEWHFRYVGIPHALIMLETGFCLEEYIEWIRNYPLTRHPLYYEGWTIGYVSQDMPLPKLDKNLECSISGDNVKGWIVTCAGHVKFDTVE